MKKNTFFSYKKKCVKKKLWQKYFIDKKYLWHMSLLFYKKICDIKIVYETFYLNKPIFGAQVFFCISCDTIKLM